MEFWFGRIYKNITDDELSRLHIESSIYEINKNNYVRNTFKNRALMKKYYKDLTKLLEYEKKKSMDISEMNMNDIAILLDSHSELNKHNKNKMIDLIESYRDNYNIQRMPVDI